MVASAMTLLASELEWFVGVAVIVAVLEPLLVSASALEPTVLAVEPRVAVVVVVVEVVVVLKLLGVVASALEPMMLVVEPRVAEVAVVALLEPLIMVVSELEPVVSV
ncbi:hypothetical protein PF008_g20880 [Phytophthora fragariae]|uniref:Uncharacterized protein n=1 Tax=Phytophthora fragariae TaxID=53985 RepID=A0A6G0QYY6_9STRA|nr:hypothetical protein PF008_g20880 [Phytophthora fragariae]